MYHLHDPLPSLLLTFCMNEVRRKQIYIALSGKRDGGSMHAIVNRTYRCTIHTSQMKIGWYSFSFLHTTINRWRTTLRNLHDDICSNKHIYYIMSGRYNKLHFCNVAVWTKVCTDHKWKLGDIFQLHTTINLTPTLSVRWEIIDGRLRSSCADNA